MASNVIVLAPNGRRQNVKVTPNTTILQIMEEVCKKQGLQVDDFDVKHHNKILDVSSIIRFSGLPNNAQLELCTIKKIRSETQVTLGLQLENGNRLMGNFSPNDNLWHILHELCPEELTPDKSPVVIYMRQEIYSEDKLKSTVLKSLGLTSGRAMIRLIHRTPEELRTQANVSAPLPQKPQEEKLEQPFVRKIQRLNNDITPEGPTEGKRLSRGSSPTKSLNFITDFIKKEKGKTSDTVKTETMENPALKQRVQEDPIEDIVFLGQRSALAFSLDMAPTVPHEELPDEFFDLTIKDARRILKDLKQKRLELEENPLKTSALRNLEKDKKTLRTLHQHTKSIIRVQFPDRTVLQGTFKPLEIVQDVKNFVKEYLENAMDPFHLYTTPPKSILQSEISLLDSNCVPSAVVHFGLDLDKAMPEGVKYIKSNLFAHFISPSIASLAAARSRGNERKLQEDEISEDLSMEVDDTGVNVGASTSTSQDPELVPYTPREKYSSRPQEKVPKWFKPNK